MPVISFASPKGGAGKTTASLLLATELAEKGLTVTIIDCDPRQWCYKWGQGGNMPASMDILPKPNEGDIIDVIEEANTRSSMVIVDLEGTNSTLVAYAISRSTLVVIPAQAGPMEGESASDAIKLVKMQQKAFGRKIPYVVLMTRTSAAIRSKIEKELILQMRNASIPVFKTQLLERNAYKAIIANKCCLSSLPSTTYKLDDAKNNAKSFAGEVLGIFKNKKKVDSEREVAA